MAKKSFPERGVGSNQYADKPPRSPSEEEKVEKQKRSSSAAQNLQDFVSEEIVFDEEDVLTGDDTSGGTVVAFLKTEKESLSGSTPGPFERYENMLRHPANVYLDRTIDSLNKDETSGEWSGLYPENLSSSSGEEQERLWAPTGRLSVGYDMNTETGEASFIVSLGGVTPPDDMLGDYGIDDSTVFIFGESDRVRVGFEGEIEDLDPSEDLPEAPAVPFSFLPENVQSRVRELANFHVQMGPIWEAHYQEKSDTWKLLVKYGDGFKWEIWPPEKAETLKKVSVFTEDL